jgi:hypothetical protein
MKFTKEQIKTAIAILNTQGMNGEDVISIKDLITNLDSLLKPETKFIDVRVEYNDSEFGMSAKAIQESISNFDTRNEYVTKVTELPEMFTREDMIELASRVISDIQINHQCYPQNKFGNDDLEIFLSERSKK